MEPFSAGMLRQSLTTRTFGREVVYFDRIGSTNTELKRLALAGAAEGTLAVTDEQTAGRGRFERTWHAPARSSLLVSLLFRPLFLPPDRGQYLTMICALAAAEAVAGQTGLAVGLKWPNDLVYRGRKLAGLLAELGFEGDRLDWAVVGMGLNVNVDFEQYQPAAGLSQTATSLQMMLGRPIERLPLLQAYLAGVENRYRALKQGRAPQAEWADRLVTLGQTVTVSAPDDAFLGVAEGVDEGGGAAGSAGGWPP